MEDLSQVGEGEGNELVSRDKESLDIFRLKDESLEASDNLPDPGFIVRLAF